MSEFTKSGKANQLKIDNTRLTEENKTNIANLIANVLQPVRDKVGFAMTITSGFLCEALHKADGGVANSQHKAQNGAAADIQCLTNKQFDVKKTRQVFAAIAEMDVDQLLYERDSKGTIWIHVSYVSPSANRHMIRDNYMVK